MVFENQLPYLAINCNVILILKFTCFDFLLIVLKQTTFSCKKGKRQASVFAFGAQVTHLDKQITP